MNRWTIFYVTTTTGASVQPKMGVVCFELFRNWLVAEIDRIIITIIFYLLDLIVGLVQFIHSFNGWGKVLGR